jgi:hypothetical protein
MTFFDDRGQGNHFRGKYSPAGSTPAEVQQESIATERSLAESESGVRQVHVEPPIPNSQHRPTPIGAAHQQPKPPRSPTPQLPASQKNALIAGILLAGGVAILAAVISNRPTQQASLSWQSSCGSPPVSGSSWWPVLGPAEAVETVRSRFCGDAYVTADGAAQVASFSSNEDATAFAQRLSVASGFSFRVGQPQNQ